MKRIDVANKIKNSGNPVRITGNKLTFDVIEGITIDILMADFKHRILDYVSANMADKFGLTRAMLVNDDFVQRFELLEKNEASMKQLSIRIHSLLKAFKDQCSVNRELAEVFSELSQVDADMARRKTSTLIGEAHRQFTKGGLKFIKESSPIIADMNTFLSKAIPDSRATIRHYLDLKYIFLSFCLKVQLMDEEEAEHARSHAYLGRLSTGNAEYRIALRCQHMAKRRFLNMRQNVTEKLYLLDNKRLQDLQSQLCKFAVSMHHHMRQSAMFASGISFPQHDYNHSELAVLGEATTRLSPQPNQSTPFIN
ncbi:PRKCA-binding protein-like isoform X2 [Sycon ciliatum]